MKLPTQSVYKKANELIIIVYNNSGFAFAEAQAAQVGEERIL